MNGSVFMRFFFFFIAPQPLDWLFGYLHEAQTACATENYNFSTLVLKYFSGSGDYDR